jgi:hypothetical protein
MPKSDPPNNMNAPNPIENTNEPRVTTSFDCCRFALLATMLLGSILSVGCTSTSSTQASALKTTGAKVDLSSYQTATVIPFTQASTRPADQNAGSRFAMDIAARLKSDFGPLFTEVQMKDQPTGAPNELIVAGNIRSYKPGSRFGRAMLIGVTPAVFKADLILKDGASGKELLTAPIDKLWAWGGLMGAGKGIEEMLAESAAAAARTVAEGKGWNPSAGGK